MKPNKVRSKGKPGQKREQPRKDSRNKRVNYDNTREDKFRSDMERSARMESDKSNDISWYAHNPELLKSAASIAWSSTVGLPLQNFGYKEAVSGVMGIQWSPVVGAEFNAPLTQVMNEMYSYVVHANSRNTKYNSPDLMAVILAGSSAFAAFAMGVRAYGTARLYSQLDYYTPDALLRAQGFDPSDIRKNLSHMWFDLNELAARLTQIWIPNTMPLLERWFWLSSNIYRDGESAKSQYYLFVPSIFYQFGIVENSSGCTPVTWGTGTAHTWSAYTTMMGQMIDALLTDEDRGIMMGDMLKAYGPDKLFAVNAISADYSVQPVYDREVLTQIENLSVFGSVPTTIAQDSNKSTLIQNWPRVNGTISSMLTPASSQILNFHQKEAPTPEQIMIATRLKVAGVYVGENTGSPNPSAVLSPNTFGTEVVNTVVIYYYDWSSGSKALTRYDATSNFALPQSAQIDVAFSFRWCAFDWAPWCYRLTVYDVPDTAYQNIVVTPRMALGDYDNYITITEAELRKMHRTAVYSEFGVPVL